MDKNIRKIIFGVILGMPLWALTMSIGETVCEEQYIFGYREFFRNLGMCLVFLYLGWKLNNEVKK